MTDSVVDHDPSPEGRDEGERVPVVGIGASAGGLGAAEAFFRGLPEAPGLAFVVVQHLAPDHESEMAELLQNHTRLLVTQAQDGEPVERDHIYTIPPGRQLTLRDGVLRLAPAEGERGRVQSPIDQFFRSLAVDLGAEATCVILSGTGTDGTLGLKAVKEAGGLTLVQDPKDAEYDGMPRSAVGTGLTDIVAPATGLAERLLEFRASADRVAVPHEPEALPEDGTEALSRIFANLRDRTGHDFSHYKRTSVLRRLGRRMQVVGLTELPAYLEFVRENPTELDALFRDLLISVTNFFRDPESWAVLEEKVIPGIFEGRSRGDTVRAWVPGCATGEEAYTVALLLADHASRLDDPPKIQVFATDIDEVALAFAREAVYPETVAGDLPEDLRELCFEEAEGGLRVRKSIRETVLFASHNLLQDAPFSRQDLISCRNLLIYLSREVQETAFQVFHYALRRGGFLFLGSSESADGADGLFVPVSKRHRIYERGRASSRIPTFATSYAADPDDGGRTGPLDRPGQDRTAADRHRDRLIRERVPATLLVDADYEIRHIAGGAHRFLRDVDGVPTRDVLEKILPPLRLDLRTALFQALQQDAAAGAVTPDVVVDGERRTVEMEVVPLDEEEFQGRFAEVVFRVREPAATDPVRPTPTTGADVASHLEEELDRTRERLQTVIEEYETTNEELKASNEELQSTNEELRSTTEELETSKEELQSMNEELVTVNQELRNKIAELARANSDLSNLMGATEIGTVFLDRDLRIKRYTPPAEALFHLRGGDVGRPLRAINQRLTPHDLVDLATEVLDDLTPRERELRGENGEWFIARVRPYRTVEDSIEGVVLTFLDVTSLKTAERRARFQADVLGQVNDAVFALDADGRVIYMNPAAVRRFDLDPADTFGERLSDRVSFRAAPDQLADLERALKGGEEWRGELGHTTGAGNRIDLDAGITPLTDEAGDPIGSLAVLRDITGRKRAERLAHERLQYLHTALRNVPIRAAIVDTDLRYRWIYNLHPDFDAGAAIGKSAHDLNPSDPGVEELVRLKRHVLDRRESVSREIRFEHPDGARVYNMTVDPLYSDDGELIGLTSAGLDITEQIEREEELEVARKAAESANASKAAFLAAMSHELRTPLNAITGYVDLMEMGVPDPLTEAQEHQVERIRVSARHLLQLIEEILQFARVDAGQESFDLTTVQVSDLVEEILAILHPLAEKKGLEFRVSTDGAPETIESDPRKLRQVLLNLLGNAVKFTSEGRVELRLESDGREGIRFHVIDTGTGMTAEEVEHIFEPFWQSDRSLTREAGGSGLGLAISHRYVDMLGGTIHVRSAPGSGAVFTVTLPG